MLKEIKFYQIGKKFSIHLELVTWIDSTVEHHLDVQVSPSVVALELCHKFTCLHHSHRESPIGRSLV